MVKIEANVDNTGFKTLNDSQLFKASHLQSRGYRFADDTDTYDTWRYDSGFPLVTTFTDSENVKWRVTLHDETDQVTRIVRHVDKSDASTSDLQHWKEVIAVVQDGANVGKTIAETYATVKGASK